MSITNQSNDLCSIVYTVINVCHS